MIDRLRKDLNDFGKYNPGMADGGEIQHDDHEQDADMIKTVLQKIIDEMNGMESNRIMPESKHPKVMALSAGSEGIPHPNSNHAEMPVEAEPENQDNQHEALDPEVLKTLMDRADQADESGSLPEDDFLGLPPAIADAVRKRKESK